MIDNWSSVNKILSEGTNKIKNNLRSGLIYFTIAFGSLSGLAGCYNKQTGSETPQRTEYSSEKVVGENGNCAIAKELIQIEYGGGLDKPFTAIKSRLAEESELTESIKKAIHNSNCPLLDEYNQYLADLEKGNDYDLGEKIVGKYNGRKLTEEEIIEISENLYPVDKNNVLINIGNFEFVMAEGFGFFNERDVPLTIFVNKTFNKFQKAGENGSVLDSVFFREGIFPNQAQYGLGFYINHSEYGYTVSFVAWADETGVINEIDWR